MGERNKKKSEIEWEEMRKRRNKKENKGNGMKGNERKVREEIEAKGETREAKGIKENRMSYFYIINFFYWFQVKEGRF
ncbi:hypothetical protein RCL_jg19139.t1 [Rhizophagus clarus]|uniref:Uncharacterized protein n=1 Tax=Rhizophagus clarus TaxID=94130 RepID=A0A8H3M1B5_9GLOM|nr:hypothetical protein RCL_jg19139.t1 [Rhizophagus clarus]